MECKPQMISEEEAKLRNLALGTPPETTPREPFNLSEEHKKEIKDAFEFFDVDKLGVLDLDSLKFLLKSLDFDVSSKEIIETIMYLNLSQARLGYVDYDCYMQIMFEYYSRRDPLDYMKRIFRYLDTDSSGKISLQNLSQAVKKAGMASIGERDLIEMIKDFDDDEDGEISLDEFLYVMSKTDICGKVSVPVRKEAKNLSDLDELNQEFFSLINGDQSI